MQIALKWRRKNFNVNCIAKQLGLQIYVENFQTADARLNDEGNFSNPCITFAREDKNVS